MTAVLCWVTDDISEIWLKFLPDVSAHLAHYLALFANSTMNFKAHMPPLFSLLSSFWCVFSWLHTW